MELDEKLKTIVRAYGEEVDPHGYDDGDHDAAIEQIKRAFIDEGWAPLTADGKFKIQEYNNARQLMTGLEWYARFSNEFRGTPAGTIVTLNIDEVMKAAKRASGVEK